MSYSSGLLKYRVVILNKQAASGFGETTSYQPAATVWADVTWTKGVKALREGTLDAYDTVLIRMRWNNIVKRDSLLQANGVIYQIQSLHADRQANTIQMTAVELANQQVNIVPPVPENALYDADGILLMDVDSVCLTADYN